MQSNQLLGKQKSFAQETRQYVDSFESQKGTTSVPVVSSDSLSSKFHTHRGKSYLLSYGQLEAIHLQDGQLFMMPDDDNIYVCHMKWQGDIYFHVWGKEYHEDPNRETGSQAIEAIHDHRYQSPTPEEKFEIESAKKGQITISMEGGYNG